MIRKWAEDIRVKTRDMERSAKVEYVMNYYWYHILLSGLFMGLLILGIYHVTWGKNKTDFSIAIVNQDINYQRDETLQKAFAAFSGLPDRQVEVDSDYLISYSGVRLKGVNESSFEKFFFSWSAGMLDAVVMPKSFYNYCKAQNGTFVPLTELADIRSSGQQTELFLEDDGVCMGVYVNQTGLCEYFQHNEKDPYVLVFPTEMKHRQAAGRFLEYSLQ